MNQLLQTSKEDKVPIELMYQSTKGEITHRTVLVKDIQENVIHAYCLLKQQPRIFKRSNILSVAHHRAKKRVRYA